VHKTTITSAYTLTTNLSTPGLAVISLFGVDPLVGSAAVVEIEFVVLGGAGAQSAISLTQGSIDEGAVPTCLDGGTLAVCAGLPDDVASIFADKGTGGATELTWSSAGGGVAYDLASGTLAELFSDRSTVGADCLANDLATTSLVDTRANPDPLVTWGYYYMVRAGTTCGAGSYGDASSGEQRVPAAACP